MIPLLAAVLTASLLGSAHCAGMCGAFVAFAVGTAERGSRWAANAAYNFGRLVTYIIMGAAAGVLGSALDLGGSMLGVQRMAAAVAGGMMLLFGVVAVLRHLGFHIPRLPLPGLLARVVRRSHERAFRLTPLARAAVVGLSTTLLPCGWLYAFVITSAGVADPVWSALTMATFWIGTLPVMAALGFGVQSLAGPMRRHLPLATSVILVVIGGWTLTGRLTAPVLAVPAIRPHSIESATRSIEHMDAPGRYCPLCDDTE